MSEIAQVKIRQIALYISVLRLDHVKDFLHLQAFHNLRMLLELLDKRTHPAVRIQHVPAFTIVHECIQSP